MTLEELQEWGEEELNVRPLSVLTWSVKNSTQGLINRHNNRTFLGWILGPPDAGHHPRSAEADKEGEYGPLATGSCAISTGTSGREALGQQPPAAELISWLQVKQRDSGLRAEVSRKVPRGA
ncbi:hypothetical protein MG293_020239 [Ovis ammon polii]|uniref:Uncharacterized protein n=1 Tax=Ovis ammon polii TaxID=230172 RepID=A0AAD4TN22_OVIAM|nr:hypothetical protein MG293_020239 [Ovis ammon polii]KAI4550575.1 hypothetical protein MJT46_018740 [Ovis ammon polii x Ovis aries]